MNDYGYNLDQLMTVNRLLLLSLSFPNSINDTLSDIKGNLMIRREGDVMACCGRLFHTRDTATMTDHPRS